MKLGLITDVHEHVSHLRSALATFRREKVDQIVMIGDVFFTGEYAEETCRLLADANAIGVWGNHDHWISNNSDEAIQEGWSSTVVDFMSSLQPSLEVAGCHFAHIEPWLDPSTLKDLWYFEGAPDEHGKLDRIFEAVTNRLIFMGHYHCWLIARPDEFVDWNGNSPIVLDGGRYFLVIGALCEGKYATLDTDTSELVPFNEA